MFLEVMIEDNNGGDVDQAELNEWADRYGLTMPVISDPGSNTMYSYATGGTVYLPFIVLLDKGVVVKEIGDAGISDLDALLAD